MTTDILLINPGSTRKRVYQNLSKELSAVEPPFWAAITAGYVRSKGFSVDVLDANALNLGINDVVRIVSKKGARLVNIVVYGQHPAASTALMDSVNILCNSIKNRVFDQKIIVTGLHPSALPVKTLQETKADFVGVGEGVYTVLGLLQSDLDNNFFPHIKGLVYNPFIRDVGRVVYSNGRASNVDDLTGELGEVAWDLLPKNRYRAHNWQALGDFKNRRRYASISTSLGCPYKCKFCAIHATFGEHKIRYWSPEWVLSQIDYLVDEWEIKYLKIIDEMFVYNPQHFLAICDGLIERDYGLNIWAYTRVDTVKKDYLNKLKRAGFEWLGIGIESAVESKRKHVMKGLFRNIDIKGIIRKIKEAGINVNAAYIFGLPDDDMVSMQSTLDLAMELNCEWANFYSNMSYPGSEQYDESVKEGLKLPDSWIGYSQHSYETLPLATKYLSSAEVLGFRDDAFHKYYTNPDYLGLIEKKFGSDAKEHILDMTRIRLKRKLLGD